MEITPFKMLLLDAAGHSALLADGPSGQIIAELALPRGFSPVDLATSPGTDQAFIALAGSGGDGQLLTFTLRTPSLARIPLTVPQPAQIAARPGGKALLITDPAGTPYHLDLMALTATPLDKPPEGAACVGLAATADQAWGVWETSYGGVLAAIAPRKTPAWSLAFGGLPTGLAVAGDILAVPFTATPLSGEGLLFASTSGELRGIATLQCSQCAAARPVYPVHAAVDTAARIAYAACEDSAAICAVNIDTFKVVRTIVLGRSVSRLVLVPDSCFAVASSNASADLCLVDLANGRPLSFTASRREILSPLAIID